MTTPEPDIGARLDELERRIGFRLDRHQLRLDRAVADGVPRRAPGPLRRAIDRLCRVPAGIERRVRMRRLRHVALGRSSEAVAADLAARRCGVPDTGAARLRGPVAGDGLVLPTSEDPTVSIVIPVHGAIDDVFACLRSIERYPLGDPFEVIIANDASDPDEFDPLRRVGGIVIVDIAENLGFLQTCNLAVAHARGDYVWLLNSDTEITPDAGDALVNTLRADPDAGAAGSKLVYPDGTLQEAGGLVWRDGSAWNVGKGGDPDDSEWNYARRVDYVSAASLMIERDLWNNVGGFDLAFVPAFYEDTDLCMQLAVAGRRVIYQSASVVIHHEGRSYGTDVSQRGKHHQVLNHQTFLQKWAEQLEDRRANGDRPELERERHVTRRILVIDARMLTPDQDSGSMRMQNLLTALTSVDCRCTFLPHNMALDEPYAQDLRRRGIETVGGPRYRTVESFLRARGAEFDAVVLSRLEVAAAHLSDVRRFCPDATIVYDTVDLHFLRLLRAARHNADVEARLSADVVRDDEIAAIERSDATLVCSTVERDLLAKLVPGARIEVVGNVHVRDETEIDESGRSGLLFVGGFEHPPNVDAVLWFVEEILPGLVERHPDVVLHVVGSRMIPEIEALAGPNVRIHGFVADLHPLYRSVRVSVAPLRFGAGVKGKVTQALAVGLPTVGTTIAVEGASVHHDEHVLVADTAAEFIEQTNRLITDDVLWRRLAAGGLDTVRRHFGPEAALAPMADILELGPTREQR